MTSFTDLIKDICTAILEGEDTEVLVGKAAFLQAIVDDDWGTIDSFSPVYGEGKHLLGVEEK